MYKVNAEISCVSDAVKYIQEQLEGKGCQKSKIMKTALLYEEIMVQMIQNASKDSCIEISFKGRGKNSVVELRCPGDSF